MKEKLFCLIEEKREAIKKLQMEYHILLTTYHSLPSDEETILKQKECYQELVRMFDDTGRK